LVPLPSTADFYQFSDMLTAAERDKLRQLEDFLAEHVSPHLAEWWENAVSPVHLRPMLAKLHLDDDPALLDDTGQPRAVYRGFRNFVFARCDLSVGMLYDGQVGMFRTVATQGGSAQQRARLDGPIRSFDLTGCFALTEPDHGSDIARGLATSAVREGDTWRITGRKRWIGNAAHSETIVVIARDEADGQAKAFLVPRTAPGMRLTTIENKLSIRLVENSDIELDGVEVPESDRLQNINSFADIAAILAELRPAVTWFAAGMQAGAYEAALRYTKAREQFGRPIAGFQLIQEKLARMLGNATATLGMAAQLSTLRASGRGTEEHSALAKMWTSDRLRETVALAREVCGGEGIIVDNDVARFFGDAEAVYTYEGTREINALIVGRAVTGHSAFVK